MSDSQQQRVSVSSLAHLKIILHAIANPYSQIHGILVGRYYDDGPRLRIVDALPVCHSSPTKPVLDMAFRLADEFCSQQGAQEEASRIVGWYTANERLDDPRPNQAALRVAGTIGAASSSSSDLPAHAEPVLVVLDNVRLGDLLESGGGGDGGGDDGEEQQTPHAIRAYGRDVRKHWVNPVPETHFDVGDDGDDDDDGSATWDAARKALSRWSKDTDDVDLYDFEGHMDGGAAGVNERDWLRNPAVKL